MGFLSGITNVLGGGTSGNTSSNSTYANSGTFGLLPQPIQGAYTNYANAVNNQIPNAAADYTPMPLTPGEQTAITNLTNGFTPNQQSITSDVNMITNPFTSSVIDPLNRQAQSDFSVLKQNASQAGQFGSNRQSLGANDIENTRESNIGGILSGQYNNAIQQMFSSLIPQRQQDATDALTAGTYARNIADQTKQAPITGLQQIGSALSPVPNNTGSYQTAASTNGSTSTNGNPLQAVGTAASLISLLSDRKAKEDIISVGSENGWRVYEFNYKGDDTRYIGVMADEVDPAAVTKCADGFMRVDYCRLGVNFREAR